MTLAEYWAKVDEYNLQNPQQRQGQAAFNVLMMVRPDLSEQIRGTRLDPFYKMSTDFMDFITENW